MVACWYSQIKIKNYQKKKNWTHIEKLKCVLISQYINLKIEIGIYYFIIFYFRVAGTIGAVLTCPLEVVKTRLQSSTAFTVPARVGEIPGASNVSSDGLLRPEQRRKLCTTILRKRPQVC